MRGSMFKSIGLIKSRKIYNISEIAELVAPIMKKYDIKKAYIFGSYARNEAKVNSDIDILIEIGDTDMGWTFYNIIDELEDVLNKKIDLVDTDCNDKFMSLIKKDLVKVYG